MDREFPIGVWPPAIAGAFRFLEVGILGRSLRIPDSLVVFFHNSKGHIGLFPFYYVFCNWVSYQVCNVETAVVDFEGSRFLSYHQLPLEAGADDVCMILLNLLPVPTKI